MRKEGGAAAVADVASVGKRQLAGRELLRRAWAWVRVRVRVRARGRARARVRVRVTLTLTLTVLNLQQLDDRARPPERVLDDRPTQPMAERGARSRHADLSPSVFVGSSLQGGGSFWG